jgi:hypothetical protein
MLRKRQLRKEKESLLRWDEDFLLPGMRILVGMLGQIKNSRCDLAHIHVFVILRPWTELADV